MASHDSGFRREPTQRELREQRLQELANMQESHTPVWIQRTDRTWVSALISEINEGSDEVTVAFKRDDGVEGKKNILSQKVLEQHREHLSEIAKSEQTQIESRLPQIPPPTENPFHQEIDRINKLTGKSVTIRRSEGSNKQNLQYNVDGILGEYVFLSRVNPTTHKLENRQMRIPLFVERLVENQQEPAPSGEPRSSSPENSIENMYKRIDALQGQMVQIRRSSGEVQQYRVEKLDGNSVELSSIDPTTDTSEKFHMKAAIFLERLVEEKRKVRRSLEPHQAREIEGYENQIAQAEADIANFERSTTDSWIARNNPFGQYKKLRVQFEKLVSTPTGTKNIDTSGMSDGVKEDLGNASVNYFTSADLAVARKLSDGALIDQVFNQKIYQSRAQIRKIREGT